MQALMQDLACTWFQKSNHCFEGRPVYNKTIYRIDRPKQKCKKLKGYDCNQAKCGKDDKKALNA